jgi:hypothetical protein
MSCNANVVGDVSSPIQANKLLTDIPTPLRNNIARVGDRLEHPFFDRIIEDDETGLPPSIAYKAIAILTVMVPVTEFNKIITVNTCGAKWKEFPDGENMKKGKSYYLREWIEEAIPAHLALTFDQSFCLDFLVEGKKAVGCPRKHPYLLGAQGNCSAKSE